MVRSLMRPKIDFAFKEIMAEERARTGFLSAVPKLEPERIRGTSLLNTYLRREHEDDEQGILDVRVSLKDGTEIDIEIQITKLEVWACFLRAEREEGFTMLAKKDPYIESAYERLQIISQDREKRWEYEARAKR